MSLLSSANRWNTSAKKTRTTHRVGSRPIGRRRTSLERTRLTFRLRFRCRNAGRHHGGDDQVATGAAGAQVRLVRLRRLRDRIPLHAPGLQSLFGLVPGSVDSAVVGSQSCIVLRLLHLSLQVNIGKSVLYRLY